MSDETKPEKAAEKAPATKAKAAKVQPGDFVTHESRPGELGRVVNVYSEDVLGKDGKKTGEAEQAHVTWPKSRVESTHPPDSLTAVEKPKPKPEPKKE